MPRHDDKDPAKNAEDEGPSKTAVARIAQAHPTLAHSLRGHSQVLFSERRGARTRREDGDPNRVLLGVYDYERDRSVVAVVDTARKTVLAVDESDAQFQLSDEERREAEEIAAADAGVRNYLAGRAMNPLTRLYFPPTSAVSSSHRHAIVFVRPNKSERKYAIERSKRAVDIAKGTPIPKGN